ncbi:HIT-like protein [Hesseltinella vesiculosa]|uniref:HIT-like protein n=1 Tax=Hesseltinella vesiculosa TaxID=101127 RepID=A0A1X2GB78_9FUNG|nr:HIT-like protein [Hesseltinella vesiculosa]
MVSFQQHIKDTFDNAIQHKRCHFFENEIFIKEDHGIKYQINYVPSLAKKAVPSTIHESSDKLRSVHQDKPINPFLCPDPALVVKEVDNYRILLNKFCIIPHHLLIVTKEFQEQSQPLLPPDLLIAWRTMEEAYAKPGVIFYNCGEDSGASQRHKHVQLIPVSDQGVQPPIQEMLNKIDDPKHGEVYSLNELPFVHVLLMLDPRALKSKDDGVVEEYLGQMYFGLLDSMFHQIRLADPSQLQGKKPSYNFIMTDRFMMLVPRRSETGVLTSAQGNELTLSMNSMSFAGYLLAKTEEERDTLQNTPDLMAFLQQLGFDRPDPAVDQSTVATTDAPLAS